MDLTPNDVEQKAFTQALRGYQMDEVDDFLDEIVTTLRSYDQRLRDAQDKIRALETDAVSRGGDETTISRAILVAQRSADALLAEAKVDADRIRHTAKAETESLSAAREMERSRLQGEIDAMRDRVSSLRQTLAALAKAVGEQVDGMEDEMADAEVLLQPSSSDQMDTDEILAPAALLLSDDEEPASRFERSSRDSDDHDDDAADDQASDRPLSIDLNEADDDDVDFDKEEVVSRISARPWERG
jgi:cell division initiation protein